jgi:hypothetical protein
MDENERKLRAAADAAARGVIGGAMIVLVETVKLLDRGQFVWKQMTNTPPGMVAYEGKGGGVSLLTAKAKIVEEGGAECYRGTAAKPTSGMVVVIPPAIAEYAFYKAVAQQN